MSLAGPRFRVTGQYVNIPNASRDAFFRRRYIYVVKDSHTGQIHNVHNTDYMAADRLCHRLNMEFDPLYALKYQRIPEGS